MVARFSQKPAHIVRPLMHHVVNCCWYSLPLPMRDGQAELPKVMVTYPMLEQQCRLLQIPV